MPRPLALFPACRIAARLGVVPRVGRDERAASGTARPAWLRRLRGALRRPPPARDRDLDDMAVW